MKSQKTIKSSYKHMVSYFDKYRKELEKISTQIGKKGRATVSYNLHSPEPKTSVNRPVFSEVKLPTSAETIPIVPIPVKITVKKSPIIEHQPEKPIMPLQVKEDVDNSPKQNQTMREVQLLIAELDELKGRIIKLDNEKQQQKRVIDSLKVQIQSESFKLPVSETRNYAELILDIESRMKIKKEAHEAQLNALIIEKNRGHFENVELSKLKECYEEQLLRLREEYRRSEEEQSHAFLESKANRLRTEIGKLEKESDTIQQRIDNNEELKQISLIEFNRYAEVYKKQLIGQQVSNAEDRIANRQSYKRYAADIDRKKFMVKQRKIQIILREKAIIEAKKVICEANKQISSLREELKGLSNERKMTLFKDSI